MWPDLWKWVRCWQFKELNYMHGWKEHTSSSYLVSVLKLWGVSRGWVTPVWNWSISYILLIIQVKWCFKLPSHAKGHKLDYSTCMITKLTEKTYNTKKTGSPTNLQKCLLKPLLSNVIFPPLLSLVTNITSLYTQSFTKAISHSARWQVDDLLCKWAQSDRFGSWIFTVYLHWPHE